MKSNTMKYDPISYIDDLRKAGFNEEQAKAQAKGLFLVVQEQGITKRDLKELEHALKKLEHATKNDIKELETNLTRDIKELEFNMKSMEVRLLLKLGSLMILLFGALGPYIKILLH